MTEFRADLHCHTNCSDGTYSPEDIVKLAHEMGLRGLSITDHDTIESYKTACAVGADYGVSIIPGVEFSAIHKKTSVHILAYSFSLDSTLIQKFCLDHHQQRAERNQRILELLAANKMPIKENEIQDPTLPFQTMGRPHIAAAMVKKGYVSTIQEAFAKYIGEGCPCFSMGHYFSVEETLDVIHKAGGLAIIAHPHLIEDKSVLGDLLQLKFDGIEGYYGRFNYTENKRWVKIGQRRGWLITGGSDFHGSIKPHLPLGSSWIGEETFQILENHFKKNQLS